MAGTTSSAPPELEQLRLRRAQMGESLAAVQQALEQPAPGRVAAWAERVQAALVELSGDLRVHMQTTEAAEGLFSDVVARAPRLSGRVTRLTQEHRVLAPAVESLVERAGRVRGPEEVEDLRLECGELVRQLSRHRQAGADLIYEAYVVDIGGET